MGKDTELRALSQVVPKTDTEWRRIAAEAHRILRRPGDESWARTHEFEIRDIRLAREGLNER